MPTLAWVLAAGVAMALLALTGSLTLLVPEQTFKQLVLPLVALAGGSLLGGALFHLLPQAVAILGNHWPSTAGWPPAWSASSCSSSTCTGTTATGRWAPMGRSAT